MSRQHSVCYPVRARYGSKDSVRTDVVLRNEAGDIIAIYDVKTGGGRLQAKRMRELLEKTKAQPGTPIIQLHLQYGVSRKAKQIGPDSAVRQALLHLTVRRI